ncbi:hydroxyethylthiazole kinase [Paenibacillus sp. HJL G12]|uniref:Hydroxyethylthiazole kinase n=1 Tax=Paenibacillus dendrobii TaxID=2691084 RepID=A0A7X3IK29_9BACL|nr:hydroxyethylthiazole kinase [Paenibacillus dendrobii]MWV45419.1 hydroxyethylthiazole kinase [Paenibacillus dendrobii]
MMVSHMQLLPHFIKQRRPLVHNITNVVVTNFTANGLLAIGASPVMAYAREEVADMARMAGALVLNLGTLSAELVEAAILAGRSANLHGIPVLLDPVGAGATPFRTRSALEILREVRIAMVRGNAAEVAHLIGEAAAIKGVDADGAEEETPIDLAARAAHRIGTIVAITGKEDVITDGTKSYVIRGGHPIMTRVTGTGCLLTSVMGAFAAVEPDLLTAGAAALALYGAAATRAYDAAGFRGPGSFQTAFLDALSEMDQIPVEEEAVICHRVSAGRGFLQ